MNNNELIQDMRHEFNDRCSRCKIDGSDAFFDSSQESYDWIDTLITAIKEETIKQRDALDRESKQK